MGKNADNNISEILSTLSNFKIEKKTNAGLYRERESRFPSHFFRVSRLFLKAKTNKLT
jgi:hypothetical protein